jgi:SagB-type dehydrogenase family enzyme
MIPFFLRLHAQAGLHAEGDDLLIARPNGEALRYRAPGAAARALLNRLAEAGGESDELIALAQAAEPDADLTTLYYLLINLEQRGLLTLGLRQEGRDLATLEPMTAGFRQIRLDPEAAGYRLSRFAWLRREGESLALESALGRCRLRLWDEGLATLVGALAKAQTLEALGRLVPTLDQATLAGFLTLLASAEAIFPCDAAGRLAEDEDPALRHWDYHDLLFHSRSRQGWHDYPVGGTFHLAGVLPHAPAIKPPGKGARIPLPRPPASEPGPAFFSLVEARRSIRHYSDTPLTLDQLGHLLWHVDRVQSHRPANPDDPRQYEATLRPVAGAGAMHELELYLTVTRCTGLEPALYRYDPQAHALEWIRAPNADTQGLVDDAVRAAALERAPDVLITLAARFGRMSWKYQGMAYAATLKHVGVIYQQLYLVATALNLAPCALGAGSSDRFAAAAGTHYYEETSVGEFALSSRAVNPQEAS